METITALLFFSIIIIAVHVIGVGREKRLRKLAEARLRIFRTVTEMEKKMLDGTLVNGEACHDVLYRVMRQNQQNDTYSIRWKFWKRPPQEITETLKQIHIELEDKGKSVVSIWKDHRNAYLTAVYKRHPFRMFIFSVWVLGIAVTLIASLAYCLARMGVRRAAKKYLEPKDKLADMIGVTSACARA